MQAHSKVCSQSSSWHSGSSPVNSLTGGAFPLRERVDEVVGSIAVLPLGGMCVEEDRGEWVDGIADAGSVWASDPLRVSSSRILAFRL